MNKIARLFLLGTFVASQANAVPVGPVDAVPQAPTVPANFGSPGMVEAGRQLFAQKNCTQCHGAGGTGGVRLVGNQLDPESAFQTISQGRIRGGMRMPMWQGILTDEEIWQLAAYVTSLK